jgi:hypothetical protein
MLSTSDFQNPSALLETIRAMLDLVHHILDRPLDLQMI